MDLEFFELFRNLSNSEINRLILAVCAAASCANKVRGTESCNFPKDSSKFLTAKVTDAQKNFLRAKAATAFSAY